MSVVSDLRSVLQDLIVPDLKALQLRVDALEKHMNDRFDAAERRMEERFGDVNERVDALEKHVNERFERAEKRLSAATPS